MIRIVLVLAVVVAAAIIANVALLSVAAGSHERVGKLSPVVVSPSSARPAATQAASRPLRPQATRPGQTTAPGQVDQDGDEIDADD